MINLQRVSAVLLLSRWGRVSLWINKHSVEISASAFFLRGDVNQTKVVVGWGAVWWGRSGRCMTLQNSAEVKPVHAAPRVASLRISSRGGVLNEVWLKSSRSLFISPWQLHLQIKNYLSGQNPHLTETASATVPFDVFQREGFVDAGSPPKVFFFFFLIPILSYFTSNLVEPASRAVVGL